VNNLTFLIVFINLYILIMLLLSMWICGQVSKISFVEVM